MIESILNPDILDPKSKSQINISEDSYALAVLRKPEGKKNPEHVFVLIQGIFGGEMRFLRLDPVQDRKTPGKITIKVRKTLATQRTALLILETEILDDEDICGQCWSIYSDDVDALKRAVDRVNANPANYNLLGRRALLPKTIAASHTGGAVIASAALFGQSAQKAACVVTPGDNCFTAIRNLLIEANLHDLSGKLPESKDELIAAIPSLRLVNKTICEAATEHTQLKCTIL